MAEDLKKEKDYPDWWDLNTYREDKDKLNEAVELYLQEEEIDVSDLEFDESLVLDMIPTIKKKDERFRKFPLARFDTDLHKTHKNLKDTIRRKVEEVKTKHEKAKKQKEKAAADELKKQKAPEESQKMEELVDQSVESAAKKGGRAKSKSDNASAKGSAGQKASPKLDQKLNAKAGSIQNVIAQDLEGELQYIRPKCKLQVLWEHYRESKRQYYRDKSAYEAERTQTKFLKTPAQSD